MDIKELKQIVDLMNRSELTELEIEEASLKLRIRRDPHANAAASAQRAGSMPPFVVEASAAPALATAPLAPIAAPVAQHAAIDAQHEIIKSPMVGTFYRASSPESAPFASVGASVKPESVVCIIEAMKVLNEIHAEISGTVVEVLVENGHSVEYGQALFKIKRA
ncbi:MAG: acetyl-CoA carboxylase, biotin carboxyl carrier protein [Verrucomicrobia bacterium 21-51-4]|nr:MAG: acetyl-CoA carboxylase, biotin carboxyl carrier protein [Verrucomicrobia bacterium 21-51-4]HQU09032.1 acetyl-CoA carboxylase biotin carboxyl carrier protein [Opitutales bacterium]